jgi:hypothetical protein
VALIDFGLSMRFDPTTDPSTWVSTDMTGTYNAPEKISGMETGIPFQVLPADVSGFYCMLEYSYLLEKSDLRTGNNIERNTSNRRIYP